MAIESYMTKQDGHNVLRPANDSSAGAGDAGKIVALNDDGEVDPSMMPSTVMSDAHYEHTQGPASDAWVIIHSLSKYPSAIVIDSAGTQVIGHITYDSLNQITITFSGSFSGTAYLN